MAQPAKSLLSEAPIQIGPLEVQALKEDVVRSERLVITGRVRKIELGNFVVIGREGHAPSGYIADPLEAVDLVRAFNRHDELLAALKRCDSAFLSWQLGQIPGRPTDILALISEVRDVIAKAEAP